MSSKQNSAALHAASVHPGAEYDALVADKQMRHELGNPSEMTIFRWEQDESLDFPPKIQIRGRNFRSRRALEAFKARLVAAAMTSQRGKRKDRAQAQA